MIKRIICLFALILLWPPLLDASKLIKVSVVDKDYLMVYFKDGKVHYPDDGEGPGAFIGHYKGSRTDSLIAYGEELNTEAAVIPENWLIVSVDDDRYGTTGKKPVAIHRKAKVNNTDRNWNYKLDHWIFLKLPHSLKDGATYTLKIEDKINTDVTERQLIYNNSSNQSEAIHVNMIGYAPKSTIKSADLYLWMGDGGPRDYSSFEGNTVWLHDTRSAELHEVGKVSFWKKSATEAEGRNLIGSDVWNVDFSDFNEPGTYRLVVEGVGCSLPFEIQDEIYYEPYRYSIRGYYYMRVGEHGKGMVPKPRQPVFIAGEEPGGFTVYVTDLHPFKKEWRDHPGDTWDEPHFKNADQSMFWQHRLPGNPTNQKARGGHSDAYDWDRHLGHVSNIYDLLLPYVMTNGKIDDDILGIAESSNGIPDILDEARNEVDLWLSLKHDGGYGHGLTNPTREHNIMFQAGNTTMAAWANAANCAMLGDCFRISGHTDLMNFYKDEAIEAFEVANNAANKQLDDYQEVGDAAMRGRDFKMMAAAYLYNLTGDTEWEDIVAEESVAKDKETYINQRQSHWQIWATAAYLFSPQEINHPELLDNMKACVRYQAFDDNVKHMDTRPSRRSSNNNWWQTAQNLQMVALAHAISEDPEEKTQLEKAMVLEADYGLGRNPSNIVEMTGLGEQHIVNCYTTGHDDGVPGLHPGHTPYNNLQPWGGSHNGSNPRWFTERGYPDWDEGGWPFQEAHFNCRYSWANGEFTPRQTMRGKMVLYGYLYGLSKE